MRNFSTGGTAFASAFGGAVVVFFLCAIIGGFIAFLGWYAFAAYGPRSLAQIFGVEGVIYSLFLGVPALSILSGIVGFMVSLRRSEQRYLGERREGLHRELDHIDPLLEPDAAEATKQPSRPHREFGRRSVE